MDGVGNKSALDALPAVLDLDVPVPHQLKDVLRQIHKRLEEESRAGSATEIIFILIINF